MRIQFVLSEIGIGLRRNLTMTVAVVVTVAISLALFGSALLIRKQVDAMKDFWYDKVEVSVYLCGESSSDNACGGAAVTDSQRREIGDGLRAMPQVEEVFYESQQEAYQRFREQFSDSPDLIDNVTAEALPESYRVKLRDPTQFEVVASAFRDQPGVEQVQDQKALLEDFFSVLDGLRDSAWAIAAVQFLASALLISNTIQVAAFSRRRETGIMRLVGASNLYIRLPFLLEGILAGLVGATLACGALVLSKAVLIDGWLLTPPRQGLREIFQFTSFIGWGDVLSVLPWVFAAAILLAGLSSFITLQRYLRV
jgi:cell division transport system permease protein